MTYVITNNIICEIILLIGKLKFILDMLSLHKMTTNSKNSANHGKASHDIHPQFIKQLIQVANKFSYIQQTCEKNFKKNGHKYYS